MKRPFLVSSELAAAILIAAQMACSSGGGGGAGGGKNGTGGIIDSGGTPGTGGTTTGAGTTAAAGGTAGAPAKGGSTIAPGGATATGGAVVTGGSTSSQLGGRVTGGTTTTGGAATGGRATTGGATSDTSPTGGSGTGGARTGGAATGGTTTTGGARTGGTPTGGNTATGGSTGVAGTTGTQGSGGSGGETSAGVTCYTYPGVTQSPLYTITVNGIAAPVEKFTKFSPEMQVHYAHCSLSGTAAATVAVTVAESVSSYTLSPKSRNITATKSGNTITFSSGPNYLILAPSGKELLFILLDAEETTPPKLGDANVKNIADYTVDNTGATLVTSKIQSAINTASGATQNILYFPPGKYKVGELWLKSNMTVYLAGGAILYGSSSTGDFNTGSGGINIEGMQHSLIRMYQVKNTKLLGRGALDANGHAIRAAGLNASLLKIEQSSDITVDGIVVRDSSYWNTLIYRSDAVTIQNYKVINCRPTTGSTGYNNTDGVDFDESTNSKLYNAFLYTGDDSMATKNEEASGVINTKNIVHQKVVCYSNSVGCKVGTKSMGQSMDGVTFKDVDVVKAGRAMTIEAYDTAVVSNTTFEDVRVEAADSMLINLALDQPPDWRDAANTSVYKDTYFTNVSSDVKKVISLHGKSSSVGITGVHFKNLTVQGKVITSQTDPNASWDINSYVSGITFQ